MDIYFKQEAERRGYSVFYDHTLRVWTVFKEGVDAEYIPSSIFKTVSIEKLVRVYLQ